MFSCDPQKYVVVDSRESYFTISLFMRFDHTPVNIFILAFSQDEFFVFIVDIQITCDIIRRLA